MRKVKPFIITIIGFLGRSRESETFFLYATLFWVYAAQMRYLLIVFWIFQPCKSSNRANNLANLLPLKIVTRKTFTAGIFILYVEPLLKSLYELRTLAAVNPNYRN